MTSTRDITIIIVNWNAGQALLDCLSSISDCGKPHVANVIVVDNASTDGSPEKAQRLFPHVNFINSGGNIGFGRANNLARPRVTTEFVFFLNPDGVLQKGALEAMRAAFDIDQKIGAVSCKMRYSDGSVWGQLVQRFPTPWTEFLGMLFVSSGSRRRLRNFFPRLDPDKSGYVSKLCGGCLLARKSVLDAVGWFDERYFMYAEDADLCRTIQEGGWKLFYASEGEVSHAGGESTRKTSADFPVLMRCESMSKLMEKYYGRSGHVNYRIATMGGSAFRLAILAAASLGSWVLPKHRTDKIAESGRKYCLMLLWSLGLKRASIPAPGYLLPS